MKSALALLLLLFGSWSQAFAQIGISADGAAPNTSAMLDLNVSSLATKKGLLVPRMTAAERTAIAAPATGAMVYETTTDVYWHFTGTVWVPLFGTTLGWRLPSNTGITAGTHFLGTTDAVPLEFRQANRRSGWVSSASENTSWGYRAAEVNTGTGNSAMGALALYLNTTGSGNTACGRRALGSNTIGLYNTAVGYQALTGTSSSSGNTAVGSWAMAQLTGATACTAIGYFAMLNFNGTATNCTAMGQGTMLLTTGADNTALGYLALNATTNGAENTAVGENALGANNGNRNTALFGFRYPTTLDNATSFGMNLWIGAGDGTVGLSGNGLNSLTNGQYNIALGNMTAQSVTTGDYNIALGNQAGANNVTGSLCTAAGGTAGFSGSGNSQAAIGYIATSTAANIIRFGDPLHNVNLTGGYGTWQNISDARFKNDVREDVPGLAFINALRPVTYRFDIAAFHDFNGVAKHMRDSADAQEQRAYAEAMANAPAMRQTGFLAQEVDSLANALGYEFSGVHRPTASTDHYTIGYEQFVVPLVKAVQEQQEQLLEVRTEMEMMKKRILALPQAQTASEVK